MVDIKQWKFLKPVCQHSYDNVSSKNSLRTVFAKRKAIGAKQNTSWTFDKDYHHIQNSK